MPAAIVNGSPIPSSRAGTAYPSRNARRSIRDASENSTSASVASASSRNDPASGDNPTQPRPSVPTTRPAAVNAIAGGTMPGRHVCSAMKASMIPATAASAHAPMREVSPKPPRPSRSAAVTIAASGDVGDDAPMSTTDPDAGAPSSNARRRRRNPWIWISGLLAIAAAGLLIWALTTRSDLDSTQQALDSTTQELDSTTQELDSTNQELDSAKQDAEASQSQGDDGNTGRGVLLAAKALYDEFAEQLDATNEDLDATQQELEEAQTTASKAEQDAAAAKQDAADADNETDKLEAQADQAKAEAAAAESKAAIAADCAKAYVSAFGELFEGESARDQAPVVREQLSSITASCKGELAGA